LVSIIEDHGVMKINKARVRTFSNGTRIVFSKRKILKMLKMIQ